MAFTIIESIKPVKDRLERSLNQVKTMDIQSQNLALPNHERRQINEIKDRLISEKIRLQMCIDFIEALNKQWIEWAQKSKIKKEDEENYEQIAMGERNVFVLKQEAKDAIITLTMYKEEINNEIKQITSKPPITESTPITSYRNINLPQLSIFPPLMENPENGESFGAGSMRLYTTRIFHKYRTPRRGEVVLLNELGQPRDNMEASKDSRAQYWKR
ncbi:hypothetical protein LOAG_18704 [Loa loa]|uniref:Uncharacterized protein n=1 Tax=Loa loa TaxID=7209 RepID=A0A1I7VVX4_LOALO|nr:hypothetical protein LOAG_18704 [Loa loa]EJD73907.1 hypothetical protein LOAG_18704 [Loa loa]